VAIKNSVISGARAKLSLNNQVVGFATDVSCSEEIQVEAIRTLDSFHTLEFVPVGYDISFSASRVRLFGGSLRGGTVTEGRGNALDVVAKHGTDAAQHLSNVLNKTSFTATIEDTIAQATFARIEQVQVVRHNWSVTARGIVGEDIEFVGVRIVDETESA
jgi:hypothetical protein